MQIRGDVIELAASRFERRLAEELARVRVEIGALLVILFAFFRT